MKRIILTLMIPLTVGQTAYAATASGQNTQQIQERVRRAEAENVRLKRELHDLKTDISGKLYASNSKIDELKSRLDTSDQKVKDLNEQIGNRIASAETKTDQKLGQLDGSIGRNTAFLIIGGVVLVLFSGLIYLLLRRRLHRTETNLTDKILQTRKELEEESVKLDNKLIEVLATKMQLTRESGDETDHSLALKVADEVVRIQKNLTAMDPDTRGLRQLEASVRRIQDNFASNGYEIVDMLNKPYDDGMRVVANFRPDENLNPGEQVITRIIKPQVNFNRVMIQTAQIEVSQG